MKSVSTEFSYAFIPWKLCEKYKFGILTWKKTLHRHDAQKPSKKHGNLGDLVFITKVNHGNDCEGVSPVLKVEPEPLNISLGN